MEIDADGVYFNARVGPATSWNVFIYANSGTLPGALSLSATNQPGKHQSAQKFHGNSARRSGGALTAGTYWE